MTPRLRTSTLLLAASLSVVGCATAPEPEPAPSAADLDRVSQPPVAVTPRRPVETAPLSPLDDPSSPLYRKIVYFDYDSVEIQPEYVDLLRTHAGYLYRTPGAALTLEGHTDERGTREYNLALGDRRADAVRRFMVAEGVSQDKLSTLSYGEERPADPARNEGGWAKNRRVELVY